VDGNNLKVKRLTLDRLAIMIQPITTMKSIILILLLTFAAFSQNAKYDKFKDETTVLVEVKVKDNGKPRNKLDNLKLITAFSYDGQTLKNDIDSFVVEFSQGNQSWRFLRSHGLIMIVDGEREDFGKGDHEGEVMTRGVFERVTFLFSRKIFEKMVNAKTVELQLGPYEGFIDADNLAKLKAFYATGTK
jgi:hypothetical protein